MQRTVRMNHLQNPAEHLGVVFVHMYGRVLKKGLSALTPLTELLVV